MDRDAAERRLRAIVDGADALLTRHEFVREADHEDSGVLFRDWVRPLGWMRHQFKISNRRGFPQDPHPAVSAHLVFEDGSTLGIDGISTCWLEGRPALYDFPGLRGLLDRASEERVVKRILGEFERALRWFEQYSSPARTLERLKSPDRNGVGIGSEPHARAVRYLEQLSRTG